MRISSFARVLLFPRYKVVFQVTMSRWRAYSCGSPILGPILWTPRPNPWPQHQMYTKFRAIFFFTFWSATIRTLKLGDQVLLIQAENVVHKLRYCRIIHFWEIFRRNLEVHVCTLVNANDVNSVFARRRSHHGRSHFYTFFFPFTFYSQKLSNLGTMAFSNSP